MKPTTVMHKKSSSKDDDGTTDDDSNEDSTSDDGMMESSTTKHYRHITLSRGLSKYGPWGYLILGMLLCGGALLVCVLWGNDHFQKKKKKSNTFHFFSTHTHTLYHLTNQHIFMLILNIF